MTSALDGSQERTTAMTASDVPPRFSASDIDADLIEKIIRETHAPRDLVQQFCMEELAAIAPTARITQFLDVIIDRRVRLRLRQH